jgi:hypothetical protein
MIAVVTLLCAATGIAWGQDTLYVEEFTDGNLSLNWFDPWVEGDSILTANMPGNPSGDGWVGAVTNEFSGGGVGTALAGELSMADYEVQAQIYCTVNTGTYHAVIARWDTTGEINSYYYFRSDFDADQRLQLRKYPGQGGMGETIMEWVGGAVPGGVPTVDGWHHMALKCEGNQLWVYWDRVELSGCPYTDNDQSNGWFGAYVFNFMTTELTYCDDFIVLGEAMGVPSNPVKTALQPVSLSITEAYPNPFNPTVALRYENVQPGTLTLTVFDVAGRPVGVLADGFHPAGVWNVTWESHQLGAGVYYAVLEGNGQRSTYPLTLVK